MENLHISSSDLEEKLFMNNDPSEARSWNILDSYVRTKGMAQHQVESFNDFIYHGFQSIVDSEPEIRVDLTKKEKKTEVQCQEPGCKNEETCYYKLGNKQKRYCEHHGEMHGLPKASDAPEGALNLLEEVIEPKTKKPKKEKPKKEYIVRFGEVHVEPPTLIDEERNLIHILPQEARLKNLNYWGSLCLNISEIHIDGNRVAEKNHHRVPIAKIPIMVGCDKCPLSKMSRQERVESGECENDHGGYFIIKGNERVIVAQKRVNYNQILVYGQKTNKKNNTKTKYRYETETRSMSSETGHSVCIRGQFGYDGRSIHFSLPHISHPVPVGVVFKALGYTADEEVKNFIALPAELEEEGEPYLKYIYRDSRYVRTKRKTSKAVSLVKVKTQDDALEFLGMYPNHVIPKERRKDYAKRVLDTELLPHLGINATSEEKAIFLGRIINKLLRVVLGDRVEDDRDNPSNKRVESTGILFTELCRSLYKRWLENIKDQVSNKHQDVISAISRNNHITTNINKCMAKGTWGVIGNSYMRNGVSQILSRLSYVSYLSHLNRLVVPGSKEGKNIKIRQINPAQVFFECNVDTPEGGAAGIMTNLSFLTNITNRIPTVLVRSILESSPQLISIKEEVETPLEEKLKYTHVFLNGVPLGFCEDPYEFVEELRDWRTNGRLAPYVSVTYDRYDDEVHVFCDEGRMVRPLLKVQDGALLVKQTKSNDWDYLVENGYVQYLDTMEAEYSEIVMWEREIVPSTEYCEIHPSMMMGVCANMIPFPDHTQGPRNCYQSNMCKQALGMYNLAHSLRSDTMAFVMDYPQRPLVSTRAADISAYNDMPSGVNAIVAVICNPFSQEDSVVLNKASVERGLFVTTSYRSIPVEEKKGDSHSRESIELPPEGVRLKYNYSLLDERGIVRKGSPVYQGDVVVGKVIVKSERNSEPEYVDASVTVKACEEGIVDRVFEVTNPDGYKLVKVVIRRSRVPEVGDKFACFSEDHDVLTKNKGWIGISEVKEDDLICSLDPKTDRILYQKPLNIFEYDHKGKMYEINNGKVDLRVTMNHNMYVKKNKKDAYELIKAEKIVGEKVYYKKSAKNLNEDVDCFVEKDLILDMDPWLTFLGIYLAEGWCYLDKKSKRVRIAVHKERVRDALSVVSEQLDFHYTDEYDSSKRWVYTNAALYDYLIGFGKALDKHLPDFVWDLSERQSRILLEGLMLGDGYKRNIKKGGYEYTTISKKLADDVQRLALHCGYCGKIGVSQKPGTLEIKGVKTERKHPQLKVYIGRTFLEPLFNPETKTCVENIISYSGKVYCVEVPGNIIYVRRNGVPIWCGQSRSAQKGTTGMIVPQEDMPFTSSGMTPDLILNPHALPSRMTISQLLESALAKACALEWRRGDCTAFEHDGDELTEKIGRKLAQYGFDPYGWEHMCSGTTGEPIRAKIFIGPTYYQRLKHLVSEKLHGRAFGAVTTLTRQPVEGRSRDGGLRFGLTIILVITADNRFVIGTM